jgi:UDP-3-O-[3-hydroxymyristoyl] glucosamine N-acyltransferase
MPTVSLGEIVDFIDGQYAGDRNRKIAAVAPLANAQEDHLSFLSSSKYREQLTTSKAGAVVVAKDLKGEDARWIRVDHPYFAVSRIIARWFVSRPMPKGVSRQASIAPTAKLGANVAVGPFATIGDGVVLGNNVIVFQGVSIEAGSTVGDDTIIYPNAVIYDETKIGQRCIIHAGAVIGADGYGFTIHRGRHHKIPQIGSVRIEDDVEIGAGTTIDRAALGETVIGEGTKIDNLVQVAHNVKIGKHCLLVSQVGISGSCELGDYVAAGGQVGISGHLKIGNRVQLGGQTGVVTDIPDDSKMMGSPAMPFQEFVRSSAAVRRLGQKRK